MRGRIEGINVVGSWSVLAAEIVKPSKKFPQNDAELPIAAKLPAAQCRATSTACPLPRRLACAVGPCQP